MTDPSPPFAPTDLARLATLVARLRAPGGCPWDREQTLASVRAYLLEEAHEAAAAIDAGDRDALLDELGDLLFQAAFLGRLLEERDAGALGEALARVEAKMIARHPHVFGGETFADAKAVADAWERRKARARGAGPGSHLDGAAAPGLPALLAAYRLGQKAAGVGFDWRDAREVLAKVDEELAELRQELPPAARRRPRRGARPEARVAEEIGDLLFAVANLARHLEIDPEAALAAANLKFRRRFSEVERALAARGRNLADATLAEMEAAWARAKRGERSTSGARARAGSARGPRARSRRPSARRRPSGGSRRPD